jgi:hypothetical protein
MTATTPDLTIPGPTVAEQRVSVDVLNKVLDEIVGRTEYSAFGVRASTAGVDP